MLKILTSIVLILVFAGSLFGGSPLHPNDPGCGMKDMAGMDCCEKAGRSSDAPDVLAARLCCTINCQQPGPVQTGQVKPQTEPLAVLAEHPSTTQSPFASLQPSSLPRPALDSLSHSPPTYIRHLSLLI